MLLTALATKIGKAAEKSPNKPRFSLLKRHNVMSLLYHML